MRIPRPPISNVTTLDHASDEQIADFFFTRLEHALKKSTGGIAVAFPGGSTPGPILERLVQRPLEWSRIAVFPTDDREVEEDHEASNTGMLRRILEPHGALVTPLAEGFDMPRFALVWLGMGKDGHIASLFPGSDPDPRDEQAVRRITPDPLPPDAPFERVSLTIPALLACEDMVFVVRGEAKRAVFQAALRGENELPVRRLLAAREGQHTMPVTCFF
ncbi:MAG: 6-phosphogluconolactonase [Erythrobacter sp.]|uniref:6-phosphogluconolactonase n=1 Tax=Erythrobacter sp. TaxID=1042 RepID=UPI00262A6ADE|nr:6-phosphogluconolactonase [Erythrobacter sp.]MDJ0979815.1 6-phosphogluconolactonase [Erythrobacter sp.]